MERNIIRGQRAQPQTYYELFYIDQLGQEQTARVGDDERYAQMMFENYKDQESIICLLRVEKTPLRLKRWGTEWGYES